MAKELLDRTNQFSRDSFRQRSYQRHRLIFMLVEISVHFFMGVVFSSISLLGQVSSIGTAFVGASGIGLSGVSSLIGVCFGYAINNNVEQSVQYIAASVIVFTFAYVCQYMSISRKMMFMPCVVMLTVGLTLAFGAVSESRANIPIYMHLAVELLFSGIATLLFSRVGSSKKCISTESAWLQTNAWIFLFGIVLSCSMDFMLFENISIGRILALILLLIVNYLFENGQGLTAAFVVGLVIDLTHIKIAYYTVIYCFSAFLSTLYNASNKYLYSAMFLIGYCASKVIFVGEYMNKYLMVEVIVSLFVFYILPIKKPQEKVQRSLESVQKIQKEHFEQNRSECLRLTGEVFENWGNLYIEKKYDEQMNCDSNSIFASIAERACIECSQYTICWGKHREDLIDIFYEAEEKMKTRGKLLMSDFPDYFREYCKKYNMFVFDANQELLRDYDRRKSNAERGEQAYLLSSMMKEIAEILYTEKDKLICDYKQVPELEEAVMQYINSLGVHCVVGVFRRMSGRIVVMISGDEVERLVKREWYLEEISRRIGVRLCVEMGDIQHNSITLVETEPYAVEMGIASRRKTGERVCGDYYRYLKTEQGKFIVILSDGVGSGEFAYKQSKFLVESLEKLLLGGVKPLSSINLLNAIVSLRSMDCVEAASIDLLTLDLFTGEAVFYKYGAAPSYVIKSAGVQIVSSNCYSTELASDETQGNAYQKVVLSPGDVIVMMSDGVSIENAEYMRNIRILEDGNMKLFARRLIKDSEKNCAATDDMTILTISMQRRR